MRDFRYQIKREQKRSPQHFSRADEETETKVDLRERERESNYTAEKRYAVNKEIVRNLLTNLDEREQKIVIGRFGLSNEEPQTLKEIGARLGVTKERIRQIEARALVKMRTGANEQKVKISDLLDWVDI